MDIIKKLFCLAILSSINCIHAMETEQGIENTLNILEQQLNTLADALKIPTTPISTPEEPNIIGKIRESYRNVQNVFDKYEEKMKSFFYNADILSPTREKSDALVKKKLKELLNAQEVFFNSLKQFIAAKKKLSAAKINDETKKQILRLSELIKERITTFYDFLQNIFNNNQQKLHHFQFYDIGMYGHLDHTFRSDIIGRYNNRMFFYAGPGGQRPLYNQL